MTRERVLGVIDAEMSRVRSAVGEEVRANGRYEDARQVFEQVALGVQPTEFLTIPAYERLP